MTVIGEDEKMKRISRKDRILQVITESEIELFPKQIATETGLNHSTVKNYCRNLLAEGKIIQPYQGTYASKITYGMMVAPVRVHNVVLHVDVPKLEFSDNIVELIGNVKVRVQFGRQRKNIILYLSDNKGMDQDTLLFALQRGYDIIKDRYGRVEEQMILKTFELNRDVAGVRLDGDLKCFTRKGFEGFLERIYQKGGSVRSEVKVSGEMDIQQLHALLQGGVPTSNVVQGQFMLVQELKKLTQAIIHQQSQIQSLYYLLMGKNK